MSAILQDPIDVGSAWQATLSSLAGPSSEGPALARLVGLAQAKDVLRRYLWAATSDHSDNNGEISSESLEGEARSAVRLLSASVSPLPAFESVLRNAVQGNVQEHLQQWQHSYELEQYQAVSEVLKWRRLSHMKSRLCDAAQTLTNVPSTAIMVREVVSEELLAHLQDHTSAIETLRDLVTRQFAAQLLAGRAPDDLRDCLFDLGLHDVVHLIIERAAKMCVEYSVREALGDASRIQRALREDFGIRDEAENFTQTPSFDCAARPRLYTFITERLNPTLRSWTPSPAVPLDGHRLSGYLFQMDTLITEIRAGQLFDLIADWPDSEPAISDLTTGLRETDTRVQVSDRLAQALSKRLLHHGARTKDVLKLYVSMVYAVRAVDPHGVVLSRVAGPVRRYLRGRPDTIPVIVSSLLGDDAEFQELRNELDAASKASNLNETDPADMSSVDVSGGGAVVDTVAAGQSDWEPRPIDAGPSYRQSKGADVISMLISIFDDHATFVKALEVSMARALLKTRGYNVAQEYRHNEVLKRRFGDAALAKCDVMLADALDSRRVDQSIRQALGASDNAFTAATLKKLPKQPSRQAVQEDATLAALKPLITSRHFWPDLEGSEAPPPTASTSTPATLASIGPPPGGLDLKLPGPLGQAMDHYNRAFTAVRESRRLRWMSGYGSMQVAIEMKDGRNWKERVDPIKAAVLIAASTGASGDASTTGATPDQPLSRAELASNMGIATSDAKSQALLAGAFAYWVSKNVLVEIEGRAGWFVECHMPTEGRPVA